MINIRKWTYDDQIYDDCGRRSVAILELGSIRIPLCEDCVTELTSTMKEFNKIIFCYKCHNFIPNKHGLSYDGSCKHKSFDDGLLTIPTNVIGYKYCTNPYDTCEHAGVLEEKRFACNEGRER